MAAGATNTAQRVDTVNPTVTISDDQPGLATDADNTVLYTFEFSEDVQDFTTADVTVNSGGTKGDFTRTDDNTYTVLVTADDNSTANISITASNADLTDLNGNSMSADATNTAQGVDTVNPTVVLSDNHADLIVKDSNTVNITATFSEDMTSAPSISIDVSTDDDADITTEAMSPGEDATTWTYSWNVPAGHSADSATVTVAGTDLAGNAYAGLTNIVYTIDNIAPTVVLSDNHDDIYVRNADTVEITATFTEADQIDETTAPTITIHSHNLVNSEAMTESSNLVWTYVWNVPDENDGNHTVSILAYDRAGNANEAATGQTIYDIDNTDPTSEVTIADAYYGPNSWVDASTIVGTSADENSGVAAVTIKMQRDSDDKYWDGDSWEVAPTNLPVTSGTMSWAYTFAVANLDNTVTYTVTPTATDVAGNSAAGTADSFIYDTTSPEIYITDPAAGSTVSSPFQLAIDTDGSMTGCEYKEGSTFVYGAGTAMTLAGTSYYATLSVANGAKTYYVICSDAAENTLERSRSFIVLNTTGDSDAPAGLTVTAPGVVTSTTASSYEVTGTITADTDSVTVTVYNDADNDTVVDVGETALESVVLIPNQTAWSMDVPLAVGVNNFVVIAEDEHNNVAAGVNVLRITRTSDSDAPAGLAVTAPSNVTSTTASTYEVKGTITADTDSVTVTIYNDADNDAIVDVGETALESVVLTPTQTTWSMDVPLSVGVNNFVVIAEDEHNNVAAGVNVLTITRTSDSDAPAGLAVTSPNNVTSTSASSYAVTGTITADTDSVTVTIYNDADNDAVVDVGETALESVVLTPNQIAWSMDVPLAVGANNFVVIAEDEHNNVAAGVNVPTLTRTSDSDAPAGLAVIAPGVVTSTTASSYEVTGTITADADSVTVTIYNDLDNDTVVDVGETALESVVLTPGQKTWSLDVTLSVGANNFVVIAEDEHNHVATGVDVPRITRTSDSDAPAGLTVTSPGEATSTSASSYEVRGTITADTDSVTVTIYNDADNDTVVDVGETALESVVLTPTHTTWSMDVPLAVGVNNFVVIAEDEHNNVAAGVDVPRITMTSDSDAPAGLAVTTPNNVTSTSASTYEVTGTITADTDSVTVTIYNDADNDATVDVGETALETVVLTPSQTTWSMDVPLAVGVNNFVVIAEDEHNNVAAGVNVLTITRTSDSAAPAGLTVTAPSNVTSTTASSYEVTGTITADTDSVTVTIYNDADNDTVVDVGETALESVVLTPTHTTWSMDVPLAVGVNNFVVIAEDEHNNVAAGVDVHKITRTSDSAAPAGLTVTAPSDVVSTSASSYAVTGTITADTDSVTVTIYNDADNDAVVDVGETALESVVLTPSQTTWSMDMSLAVGVHNFVVIAEDEHNNVAAGVNVPTITRTSDSAAPAGLTVTSPSEVVSTSSSSYEVRGTITADVDSVTVTIYNDADNDTVVDVGETALESVVLTPSQTTWSMDVPLAVGVNNFVVIAEDEHNNVAAGVDVRKITRTSDSAAPAGLAITTPDATVNSDTYTIAGTFTADTDDVTIQVLKDGTVVVGTVVVSSGQTTWSVVVPLAQGIENIFIARATDASDNHALSTLNGNESKRNAVITENADAGLDLTAPPVPVIATENETVNSNSYVISGTAAADVPVDSARTIILYNGGTVVGTVVLPVGETEWSIAVALTQDSANVFTAYSRDVYGNMGNASDSVTITESSGDTEAPTINLTSAIATQITVPVIFTSTEDGTASIKYGLTTSYGSQTDWLPIVTPGANTITLTGLTCGTTYHYEIFARDNLSNEGAAGDGNFTTAACTPDTTAPEVGEVDATGITDTAVTIVSTVSDDTSAKIKVWIEYWPNGTETSEFTPIYNYNNDSTTAIYIWGLTPDTVYLYRVHAMDSADNEASSAEGNFSTLEIPQYKFEMPDNANGFPALSYAKWIGNYELRNIVGFDTMNLAQFLTASEGDNKLAYSDVDNAYIYDSDGNWTVLANDEFTTWDFGNHDVGFIGYYVLDLTSSGLRKFVRHLTGPDETAPTFTIVNGVAEGPVKVDTINITITGASAGYYGFSTDETCDSSDTIATAFTSGVPFTVAGNHRDYLCVKSTDTSANTGYQTVGRLNTDNTAPTVGVVVADTELKAGETSLVTFTFSEAVVGFANADLAIANGVLTAVSSADGGITWTATFTPTASIEDATNVIAVHKAGLTDVAGNAGVGTTNSNNYAIDTLRPTVEIDVANVLMKVGDTSDVTFTFSEAVAGFTNADIDLTNANGLLSDVASEDNITWTATFTPSNATDATNNITVVNTGVTDAAGNTGLGTTDSNNYAIDNTAPTVEIVVEDTNITFNQTSTVTFTFSEAVTGFTNADIDLSDASGALSDVFSEDNITWTATFTPITPIVSESNIIIVVNTGVTDEAGNAGVGTTDSNNYAVDTHGEPV